MHKKKVLDKKTNVLYSEDKVQYETDEAEVKSEITPTESPA